MNCKRAIPLMHDYLDGDLTGTSAVELKLHLTHCASCQAHYAKLERAGALISSLKPVAAPEHISTERILQGLPTPAKRKVWMKWLRRHPAASVAAVFVFVMLGSFMSMWNDDKQLAVRGSDLEQVVIKGNTVVVPEGRTVQGNLIVEHGEVKVDGAINGNLVVIDGTFAMASTAQISGEITRVNQAIEWLWFKVNHFFAQLAQ